MAFRMLLEENDLKMDPLEVKGLINFACYGEFADHFQDQLLCEAKVHDYLGPRPAAQRRHQDRRRDRRLDHAHGRHHGRQRPTPTARSCWAGSGWTRSRPGPATTTSPPRPARTSRRGWRATTRATTRRWRGASRRCTRSTSACAPRSPSRTAATPATRPTRSSRASTRSTRC